MGLASWVWSECVHVYSHTSIIFLLKAEGMGTQIAQLHCVCVCPQRDECVLRSSEFVADKEG